MPEEQRGSLGDATQVNWESVYEHAAETDLPWFSDAADPEVLREIERAGLRPEDGPVLDIGTGPGTMARELAQRGFHVTALDVSESAIEMARRRAGALADRIAWRVDSITTTNLTGPFAFAHDRGCFHVLNDAERARYVPQLAALLQPGGRLFLKTFSITEPGTAGPRRYSVDHIRDIFSPTFSLVHFEDTTFQGMLQPSPQAIFCVLAKS